MAETIAMSVNDNRRKTLHELRQKKRKRLKAKEREAELAAERGQGSYHYARTYTGLCPFNTRKGTDYLIAADTVGIVVRMKKWWLFYLTNDRVFDSIEQMKSTCKHIKVHRHEFKVLNRPVKFRTADKVVLKTMLNGDWAKNEAIVKQVAAVYS